MDAASLLGDGLAHFLVITVHFYFTTCCSGLGGQSLYDAIGGFAMSRIDDVDTAVMAYLFTCAVTVKNDDDVMGCMTVAIDELGNEGLAGRSEVARFDGAKRGAVLDDVVAIHENILAHDFAFCFRFIV